MIDSVLQIENQLHDLSEFQDLQASRKRRYQKKHPDLQSISEWVPQYKLSESALSSAGEIKRPVVPILKPIPIVLKKPKVNFPILTKPSPRPFNSSLEIKSHIQGLPSNQPSILKVAKSVQKQLRLHPVLIQMSKGDHLNRQTLSCSMKPSELSNVGDYLKKIYAKVTNVSKPKKSLEKPIEPLVQPHKTRLNSFINRLFKTKRVRQDIPADLISSDVIFNEFVPATFSDSHFEGPVTSRITKPIENQEISRVRNYNSNKHRRADRLKQPLNM